MTGSLDGIPETQVASAVLSDLAPNVRFNALMGLLLKELCMLPERERRRALVQMVRALPAALAETEQTMRSVLAAKARCQ